MLQIPLPFAQLVLSAFNHMTRQQPHLRESLRAHSGRVLRIHVISPLVAAAEGQAPASAATAPGQGGAAMPGGASSASASPRQGQHAPGSHRQAQVDGPSLLPSLQSDARIGADGSLSAVSGEQPAATLTVRPSADALFTVLRQGANALGASVRIEGDVMLASALGQVVRSLHWDLEEDLSRVLGDVPAHRAGMAWRSFRQQARETGGRLSDALERHLTHDQGVLASRAEFEQLVAGIRQLAQRVEVLEQQSSGR